MERRLVIRVLKIVVWIAGLYLSTRYHLHTLYFIISGFYLMFTNLGKRQKGSLSAYSVFNQNFQRLHGTMDGLSLFKGNTQQQPSKLVLQTSKAESETVQSKEEYFKNPSKYSNRLCFCGSDRKFKKCCLQEERVRLQQQRARRIKGQ